MTKKKHGSSIQKRLIPSYIFLVIVSFISVFPFFWMISAATNKSIDVARGKIAFGSYALENLKKLFASQNVALGMKNSFINATVQTLIALLVCSLAGYGFELYPGCALMAAGGESRDPRAVRDAVLAEGARIAREGVDEGLFRRLKKGVYGAGPQLL